MRLYAAGWLMLLIFTDSGIVKQAGDYDSQAECIEAWPGIRQCLAQIAEKQKASNKDGCFVYCGQPIAFCIQGERLTAPGLIFPLPKKESTCD